MKLQTVIAGLALALGIGMGVNAEAFSLHECCRIKQQECELNYSAWKCRNVYLSCVASGRCILD